MEKEESCIISVDSDEPLTELPACDDNTGREGSDGAIECADDENGRFADSSPSCLDIRSLKPVDSGIESKSLTPSKIDESNSSCDLSPVEVSHPLQFITAVNNSSKSAECNDLYSVDQRNQDRLDACEVNFDIGEEDESTSLLSEDDNSTDQEHPLRALSCVEVDEQDHGMEIPEVSISVPSRNQSRPECIPLRNLFQAEDSAHQRRWVERIGYKNWFLHLARSRRCEILVLIGFAIWIIFFIALAIVLNGNASDDMNENGNVRVNKTMDGKFIVSASQSTHTKPVIIESDVPIVTEPYNPNDVTDTVTPIPLTTSIMTKGSTPHESSVTPVRTVDKNNVSVATMLDESITSSPNTAGIPLNVTTSLLVGEDAAVTQFPSTVVSTTAGDVMISNTKPEVLHDTEMKNHVTVTDANVGQNKSNFEDVNENVKTLRNKMPTRNLGSLPTSNYLIGVGRADITGPAADVNMMGYANPKQTSGGVHLRQFSRAFIIEDVHTGLRTLFVNIDACMASTLLKLEVLKVLKKEFGDLYRAENFCISGTHTHSGPAGFLQDVLFQITSWGYVEETLLAMVNGVVDSIKIAHNSVQPGYILMNKGELVGSNINRSPTAYENNPKEERMKYKYNVDTEMLLLKFVDQNGNGIGMINWFPVHCTSMNNTNSLISSDNKGYAEILFENYIDPDVRPGNGNFVAAFAQSNEGDVSPNTKGPHCTDTGAPCDNLHSTCEGKSQYCVASGPGKDMFESTKIIGKNQFEKAKELYLSATVKLEGPVNFIHEYVNMTNYEVTLQNNTNVTTCLPAMGFSFAAGTTDGPGAFDFKQGDKSGNKFWDAIRNFLRAPSKEQMACHFPKPILLDTGEMHFPYDWQPQIVDTQIFQIGQLLITALPGEFSTMAGRRLRDGVLRTFKSHSSDVDYEVVIAGLANSYSDYITTHEEYLVQRYEGASTVYGPYTSEAHTQQFKKLARYLAQNRNITSTVQPKDNKDELMSFQIGVIADRAPYRKSFGDPINDTKTSYHAGEEISVRFVAGNPRNCLTMGTKNMTFLTVEREMPDGSWKVILTDADFETKFTWIRISTIAATSEAVITWQTEKDTAPGKYRLGHHGCSKSFFWGISEYSGTSIVFTIK